MGRNEFGVKFEIICSIGTPRIIWLSGPYKGAANDATISQMSGVKNLLVGESLLADKSYKGDRISFITPLFGHRFTLDSGQNAYNYLIYSARQSIERVISRLSVFQIFNSTWHHSFLLLKKCVEICCKLINLFFIFEPLG